MMNGRLAQANGRLKASNVGVSIEAMGNRLYLRSTFPPKPDSGREKPSQQRLTLGYHANPAGLKLAEQEARKVGALLDCREFSWKPYLKLSAIVPLSVGDWVSRFEADYFTRRHRSPKSETTWKTDYCQVFSQLPSDEPLTLQLLASAVTATKPDSRSRQRYVDVLTQIATFAGLDANFKPLRGNYSPSKVTPRDLPVDATIAAWREKIPNPQWQYVYGLIATYGIRPHEVFHCNLDKFPVLQVEEPTKTGQRRVYPFYPEWLEQWNLRAVNLPKVSGRNNSDLGSRVSHQFIRYEVPFPAYNLRHAWAVRSMEFGLDISLAAQQMGHSVRVHSEIYHAWISEEVHQRAYEALMLRLDRPLPPISSQAESLEPPHSV
ncbi:integrase [Phormidesmis priestleyi ULC007]|uniref:Integrase n=1 Tax=Phormidesmis priestleyi ULC007 TaxID=1920490 RepID=A0A2T1DD55_9CYAN|nr:integrase [Phormidesmis priestleyi]PSB18419.1 integrase [Phormidesmis priestleyi ULC007]PZO48854.1 MAG: integrase [Phormidesmis priestleyi]